MSSVQYAYMKNKVPAQLEALRNKYQLQLILLHGSHVSGKLHPKSDVDIAVVRERNNSRLDTLSLITDLGTVLATDRIDVADITHADPLFLYAVVAKSQLVAGSLSDFQALQLKAFQRYQDYQPFLKQEAQFIKEQLKTYVSA